MFKWVVLAVALQLAQGTASDGLIHITCTIPADVVGGVSFPALVDQIIVQPIKKVAWVNPKAVPGRFESGFPGVTNGQSLGAIRFAEERHAQGLFVGFARACDRSG